MRVLLDTPALLWFITDDARLGRAAKAAIEAPDTEGVASVASLWEIAIKHALGRLPLAKPFADLFPAQLDRDSVGLSPSRPTTSRDSWPFRRTLGTRSTG